MDAKDGSRKRRWLLLGLLVLACAFLAISVACHVGNEFGHLVTVHDWPEGEVLEKWCIKEVSGEWDLEQVEDWIREGFWLNGHDHDWDAVPGITTIGYGECRFLDPIEIGQIDIFFELVESTGLYCVGHSCVDPGDVYYQHHGHPNLKFVTVFLSGLDFGQGSTPTYRTHTINHETGHAFGLADPTPVSWPLSHEHCMMAVDRDGDGEEDDPVLVQSIMHNPGWCDGVSIGNVKWPTSFDRLVAKLIAEENAWALAD